MKKIRIKRIIVPALAALAFGSISVGTTFALFTDKAETKIQVKAGKVDIASTFSDIKAYSMDPEDNEKEVLRDDGTFYTGGKYSFDESTGLVKLENIVPGDRVEYKVKFENKSNVAIKYRFNVNTGENDGLFEALEIKFNGSSIDKSKGVWKSLEAGAALTSTDVTEGTLSIALPKEANNDYQNKSCSIQIGYEAIQGNAKVDDTWDGTIIAAKTRNDFIYSHTANIEGVATVNNPDYADNSADGFLAFEGENTTNKKYMTKIMVKPGANPDSRKTPAKTAEDYSNALANAKRFATEFEAIDGIVVNGEEKTITVSTVKGLQALNELSVYMAAKNMIDYDTAAEETNNVNASIYSSVYYNYTERFEKIDVVESFNLHNQNWSPVSADIQLDFHGNYISNLKIQSNSVGALFATSIGVDNLVIDGATIEAKNDVKAEDANGAVISRFNRGGSMSGNVIKNANVISSGTAGLLAVNNYAGTMNNNSFYDCNVTITGDHEVGALAGIYNHVSENGIASGNKLVNVNLTTYDREAGSLFGRFYADNKPSKVKVQGTVLEKVTLAITNPDSGKYPGLTALSNLENRGSTATGNVGIYEGGYTQANREMEFDEQTFTITYEGLTAKINF